MDEDKAKGEAEAKADEAPAAPAKTPAHLEPDFTGPLTGDQALERLEKFGPWKPKDAETKPAKASGAK